MEVQKANRFHQWKYPVVIGLMLTGLVFSKWLLSVSQFFLLFAVLSDKTSRKKLTEAFQSPLVLSLISIYVIHLAGMLWTSDMKYGFKDLQNKLPMLALPVLFYAAGPLKKNTAIHLLLFFTFNVFLLSAVSLINYYLSPETTKHIVIGQSHIRFSLLICLSIIILIHFSDLKYKWYIYTIIPLIAFLLFFLFILESFTGYVVLVFLLFALPLIYYDFIRKRKWRFILPLIMLAVFTLALTGFLNVKNSCFPKPKESNFSTLPKQTINGNYYIHDTISLLSENGYYMYINLSVPEMIPAWNNRSKLKIDESDSTSAERINILTRYLTSKGLSKDSAGVMQLSKKDIKNIEQGYSNYLLPDFDPYRKRIYRFLWELHYYNMTGDPSGHSLTQRFEYWITAASIIQQHPAFGCGTGDINNAFKQQYQKNNSKLKKEYRLRSHNQFLSITVALGFAGLLVFVFSLAAPFLFRKIPDYKLYLGFIFIFLLSLLNEDTLETQVGVTFYALFNSFLLFILPNKNKSENEKARAEN
ncbi:MAG TPA: O-antigen ligase family protein [Bacteroidales bacterium]|nr:O-antigen ligase family protein [Bacteroidales bacterium]